MKIEREDAEAFRDAGRSLHDCAHSIAAVLSSRKARRAAMKNPDLLDKLMEFLAATATYATGGDQLATAFLAQLQERAAPAGGMLPADDENSLLK